MATLVGIGLESEACLEEAPSEWTRPAVYSVIATFHAVGDNDCDCKSSMNVYNPLTVRTNKNSSRSWEPDFHNLLCEQIAKSVRSVDIHDGYELLIVFEDDSFLSVSLKSSDYEIPEAIYFQGTDQTWIIL